MTLAGIGYVSLGDGPDGRRHGHVFTFKSHQVVNRPKESKTWDLAIVWTHGPFSDASLLEREREWKGKWNREQGKDISDEHASLSSSPAILAFPISGIKGGGEWMLTAAKLEEYRQAYPDMDVAGECRKARQWCIDNSKKRKTAQGMPAFLSRWMATAQNSHGGNNGAAKPGKNLER